MRGVTLYVGAPGTGKTHAALEDLRTWEGERWVMDLGGSKLLESIPKGPTGAGAGLAGRFVREQRWTPETPDELDARLRLAYRRGNLALLVDDVAALPSKEVGRLCRLWRPRNIRLLLTTQHVSADVGQVVLACDPTIFAFRTTSPASLDWLWQWHRVTPDELAGLKCGEALELTF
jgi:hypothetical protein